MIEAHLFLDETTFLKAMAIPERYHQIRINSPSGYIASAFGDDVKIKYNVGVYYLERPLERFPDHRWRYIFHHMESQEERIPQDSFNEGFMEPTKEVNLDKLSAKLRNNKNLESHIKRFIRK